MKHIRRAEREQLHSLLADENVTVAYKQFVCGCLEEDGGVLLIVGGLWGCVVGGEGVSCGIWNFKCGSRSKKMVWKYFK